MLFEVDDGTSAATWGGVVEVVSERAINCELSWSTCNCNPLFCRCWASTNWSS